MKCGNCNHEIQVGEQFFMLHRFARGFLVSCSIYDDVGRAIADGAVGIAGSLGCAERMVEDLRKSYLSQIERHKWN